jgi:hypothetical protein
VAITILTWLPFLFNLSVDLTKLIHSTIVDVSPIIVSMTKTAQGAFTKSNGSTSVTQWSTCTAYFS